MKRSIKQIFKDGNERGQKRKENVAGSIQAKLIKKLGKKHGKDITNVVYVVSGQDKAGKNSMGLLWLEQDGSIGFSGIIFNAKREYFWNAEEIGNVFYGSKSVFGHIEIVTNGGFAVKIQSMVKSLALEFFTAWEDTR